MVCCYNQHHALQLHGLQKRKHASKSLLVSTVQCSSISSVGTSEKATAHLSEHCALKHHMASGQTQQAPPIQARTRAHTHKH